MLRITDAIKHLIIINVIFFIGTITIGGGTLFFNWFGLYFPKNPAFQPWQIITHMFIHGSPQHILFNMFLLWMFGISVEGSIGKVKFLFLYISAGLGAFALTLLVDYIQFVNTLKFLIGTDLDEGSIYETLNSGMYNTRWLDVLGQQKLDRFIINFNKVSMGASGAVMGILASFGYMFPNRELLLLIPPIKIKAKYVITGMIGADLISAFLTGTPLLANSNIGYTAHVGGALTGLLIIWYWKKTQFNQNRWDI